MKKPADVFFVRRDAEELRFLAAEPGRSPAALAQLELHVDDIGPVFAEHLPAAQLHRGVQPLHPHLGVLQRALRVRDLPVRLTLTPP